MKSSDINGVLNVYKERGYTSHDVVACLRKILGVRKIGHAGTLDPAATGVLICLIGKATRLMQYFNRVEKEYQAEITFGVATDTYDTEGRVIGTNDRVEINKEDLENTLHKFTGVIEQIPPAFSAVKYRGKKGYKLARKGIMVELPPRKRTVYSIELLSLKTEEKITAVLKVVCQGGTYIRTLAKDIGASMGYYAHLSGLERSRIGKFGINEALTLKTIEDLVINHRLTGKIYSIADTLELLGYDPASMILR